MQGNLFAKKYKLLMGEVRDFGDFMAFGQGTEE